MTPHERLEAARSAYHALLLGQSAREITDQNGERVVYTAANKDALRNYINQLEAEVARCATGGPSPHRGPMVPVF